MKENLMIDKLQSFRQYLHDEERSRGTIETYLRDLSQFLTWLDGRELTRAEVFRWKEILIKNQYQPVTINRKLAALNCYFKYIKRDDCRVKALKLQRKAFRDRRKELTREEYETLIRKAREDGKERLALLIETICATGIRVSEVKYITVEAISARRAEVMLKGKIRVIMIPAKLCRKLSKYVKKRGIEFGQIFVTRSGRGISRKQIWAEMKGLCERAGVEASKVFPHNLRHLFARCFYKACHDLVRLADVLGHSNIETTRIYLITTGEEHARTMERLHLIC